MRRAVVSPMVGACAGLTVVPAASLMCALGSSAFRNPLTVDPRATGAEAFERDDIGHRATIATAHPPKRPAWLDASLARWAALPPPSGRFAPRSAVCTRPWTPRARADGHAGTSLHVVTCVRKHINEATDLASVARASRKARPAPARRLGRLESTGEGTYHRAPTALTRSNV
jgi:hypothetical protein